MTRRKMASVLALVAAVGLGLMTLSGCAAPQGVAADSQSLKVVDSTENQVMVDEAFKPQVEEILPINNTDRKVTATCNRPADSGVIVTFDDKGSPEQVQAILDVLGELNWRAAFFPIGEWAEQNWGLIQLMQKEGHVVGNHTMTHPDLAKLFADDPDQFYGEVYPLRNLATTSPMFLRPPYGSGLDDPQIAELLTERDYQMCGWTADTNDWRGGTAEEMLQRVMGGYEYSPEPLQPDGVVLAHMHGEHSVEFLRLLAAELDERGWARERLR